MQQLKDFADDRLLNGCVYCEGGFEETRDHVPSRILLDKPFPANLPVVPACADCNAAFAFDEEYVAALIDCVLVGSTDPERIRNERLARAFSRNVPLRARIERARHVEGKTTTFSIEEERVENVIVKLAKGHAAYELGVPYRQAPEMVVWCPVPNMTTEEWSAFDAAHVGGLINEVGSRNSQRMLCTQVTLRSMAGEDRAVNFLVNDWIVVQEGRYRYQAIDEPEIVRIKILLSEYLACEVTWKR
ncbi:MAG: hypothetical protein KDA88_16170 [Planctomycetaceae bacterium]|nr:hypothetical protein [Planctomycetaceae bacterium]MCB9952211.1 hypothetical protein [Planctomycetaceae bacterium]